jgi:glycogen operon protein
LFDHDGRPPSASIDYVASHDGMTLADLFSYDTKNNDQAFPYGPSTGGSNDDIAWSHGGDAAKQRGSTRAALALVALSAGVPMITGGDERLRSIRANDNPYNLDSTATWIDWSDSTSGDALATFSAKIFAFRHTTASLRPGTFGALQATKWLKPDGSIAEATYLDDASQNFVGMVTGDVYVAYSGASDVTSITLPAPPTSMSWRLAFDTSPAAEAWGNAIDPATSGPSTTYTVAARTVAVFVAR